MMRLDIRARVLLMAWLPAALIATVLASLFIVDRFHSMEEELHAKGRLMARQLAPAAEYGVFSGNREALQALITVAAREADVRAVVIVDGAREVLALVGQPSALRLPADDLALAEHAEPSVDSVVFSAAIAPGGVRLDDVYAASPLAESAQRLLAGRVVVELSRAGLMQKRAHLLGTAALVTLLILGASSFLAMYLSRGVTRPIFGLTDVVDRIGRGDLSARADGTSPGVVGRLENGVNAMAERIGAARENLEARIAAATEELKEKKDEAERANRAKSRFLAAASHDLRQPLHALNLFVAQLAQHEHAPATRRLVRYIEDSVGALDDLLDALLDISRLDAGIMVPNVSEFALDGLFERLANDFAAPARDKGLKLRVVRNRYWVRTDALLLDRVLTNLLSNAVRYTVRGAVLIGCRPRGDMLRIEVRDSGPGIAPEQQARIFEEFVQLQNPERDRRKGLGLGLAIVDRLARLLGHRLELRSADGAGATFAVEIPRARAAAVAAPPTQAVQWLDGRQLLVVDDDTMARVSLVGLLESWGCRVLGADSAEQALVLCRSGSFRPEALVCDFRLSGLDGVQLVQRLRVGFDDRRIPAMLVSGDTDPELRARARDAGLPLLSKPVRPAQLRALLHSLLARTG